MKITNLSILVLFLFFTILCTTSCKKELMTGEVTVYINNKTLTNQADFFVKAGIVFFESDDQPLYDFGKTNISKGGDIEYASEKLNNGNYYVRYQYFIKENPVSSLLHKPFQIQSGEDIRVNIER